MGTQLPRDRPHGAKCGLAHTSARDSRLHASVQFVPAGAHQSLAPRAQPQLEHIMPIARRLHGALLAALLGLVPLSGLSAQVLAPGTRVRVKSQQVVAPVIGSYQGMRRDTVVVIEDGTAAQVWSFTSATIDRLEVSAGMKGGNRAPMTRWALIGAGGGAAAGYLVAAILEGSSSSEYNDVLSAAVGAGVGAIAGAAYGYRKLEEHWSPVPIPRRVGVMPTRDGFRVGFSAAF